MIEILPEDPCRDAADIEALYDRTFGPGHFAKTAERLREGGPSLHDLTRVARLNGRLIGVCRLWPLSVGEDAVRAVFFGPLAVDPDHQGEGVGHNIIHHCIAAAKAAGWPAGIIIGARGYFEGLGFSTKHADRLRFPGPQDVRRVMTIPLADPDVTLGGQVRADKTDH